MADQPTLPRQALSHPSAPGVNKTPPYQGVSKGVSNRVAVRERDRAWLSQQSTLPSLPTTSSRQRPTGAMDVNWRYLHHLIVLTACVFLGAMVAVHLGQDVNWDFFNYHYYDGYAILTGAWRQNIAPAQMQSYLNPTLDIATYFLYTHLPAVTLAEINGRKKYSIDLAIHLFGYRKHFGLVLNIQFGIVFGR